jgi:hypothetical protein
MADKNSVAAEIRAEQKAALKNMPFKKKVAYFWEYYRFHVLITVVLVMVAVNFITSIVGQKPYSFYGIMLNSFELDGAAWQEEFAAYAELDEEKSQCYIETQTFLDIDSLDQYNIASIQRVLALVATGDLDVIVSDGPAFTYYADAEIFLDLRTVLSAEEIARYEGDFFYIDQAFIERRKNDVNLALDYSDTPKSNEEKLNDLEKRRHPENMENPIPVGIFVTDAALIKATGAYPLFEPIYGIAVSSQRLEVAVKYLEFLGE